MLQSLSPGLVETEAVPEEYLKKSPALKPEDIAAGVLYVLGAPQHVQVRAVCDVRLYNDFPKVDSCNSMDQSFLEKLTVAKMAKFHYHAHNSPPLVPNHSQVNAIYAFHPHLHLNLGVGL
jgi:hypothetical protein